MENIDDYRVNLLIDLKNGRILLQKHQSTFDYIYDFSVFAVLLGINFSQTSETVITLIYYVVFAFFLFIVGIDIINRIVVFGNTVLPLSVVWYSLFFIYALASYFWSVSPSSVLYLSKMMLQPLLLGFGMSFYITSRERIYKFLKLILLSVAFTCLYLLFSVPVSEIISVFSRNNAIAGINCNYFGQLLSTCTIISFYFAYVERNGKYYIFSVIFAFMAILTASRKAFLIMPIAIIFMMLIYRGKKKSIYAFLLVIAMFIVFGVAIFKIPTLYNIIGTRIESMVVHYVYGTDVDNSIWLRKLYIKKGLEYFGNHPVFGNGLNSFSYLFEETGYFGKYSHNNFIEMLSCLGVLGLLLYYWFYAYLLIKLSKYVLKKKKIAVFALTFIFVFTIFQYGIVAYYDKFITIMICFCFMVFSVLEKEQINDGSGG